MRELLSKEEQDKILSNIMSSYIPEAQMAASISQIDRALKNKTCCFITAFLDSNSEEENQKQFKNLSKDLQALHYGHINLKGVYKSSEERSMMISMPALTKGSEDDFINIMQRLMIKYKQDSILIKLKSEEKAFLLFNSGKKEYVGAFHVKDVEKLISQEFFSKIGNKTFVFESVIEWIDQQNENLETLMLIAHTDKLRRKFIETNNIG